MQEGDYSQARTGLRADVLPALKTCARSTIWSVGHHRYPKCVEAVKVTGRDDYSDLPKRLPELVIDVDLAEPDILQHAVIEERQRTPLLPEVQPVLERFQ